mgnify:CR=1 FL=1
MRINDNRTVLPKGTTLHGTSCSYTIIKMLGQGTFGITYLASTSYGESVAVKEFFMREINGRNGSSVTSGNKKGLVDYYRKKFVREAGNLSKLHHPNIISVREAWEENDTVYYSMEYLDGGSLDNLILSEGGLTEADALRYTREMATALMFMHNNKMLHLDLKPSNVMLKHGHAVLIDFGYAKQYAADGLPESSATIGKGTLGYAPIEQNNPNEWKEFPVTMDIYALGATMFKMLTGHTPPEASEVLNNGFPYGEMQACGIDPAITKVVSVAMAPLKKDRIPTVDVFVEMLSGLKGRSRKPTSKVFADVDEVTVVEASPAPSVSATITPSTKPQEKMSSATHIVAGPKVKKVVINYQRHSLKKIKVQESFIVTSEKMVRTENADPQQLIAAPITPAEFDEFKRRLSDIETQYEYEFDSFSCLEYDQLSIALFNDKGKLTKSYSVKTGISTRTGKVESLGRIKGIANSVKAKIEDMLPRRVEELTERYDYWKKQQGKAAAMANEVGDGKKRVGATAYKSHTPTVKKADDKKDLFLTRAITFCATGTTIATFLLEHVYCSLRMYDETFFSVVGNGIGRGIGKAYMALALFVVAVSLAVGAIAAARNVRRLFWLTVGSMLCLGAASLECELYVGAKFENMLWILFALVTLFFAWMMKGADSDKWFG